MSTTNGNGNDIISDEEERGPILTKGARDALEVAFNDMLQMEWTEFGREEALGAALPDPYLPLFTPETWGKVEFEARGLLTRFERDPEGIYLHNTMQEMLLYHLVHVAMDLAKDMPNEGATEDEVEADVAALSDYISVKLEDEDFRYFYGGHLGDLGESKTAADGLATIERWFEPFRPGYDPEGGDTEKIKRELGL